MKNRRKLRNFLINPRYQLKYISLLTATGFVLTIFNCAIFYYFIRENYSILVELVPMQEQVRNQLYSELYQIIVYLTIGSVIFLALIALVGLVISHRTAGPLYHFKRVFNEIKGGKTQARVMLRPTDDFQDVAQAFNEMMNSIEKK